MVKLFVIFAFCGWMIIGHCDERLWLDAKVNGKTAGLIFDSGSSHEMLFRKGAERLGLKITDPPPGFKPAPGEVANGWTEECELKLGETAVRLSLPVVDLPNYMDAGLDGIIGWQTVRKNVFQIDAVEQTLKPLDTVPEEATSWMTFHVRTNSDILTLEIPNQKGNAVTVITVDTGTDKGVSLSPKRWCKWRAAHSNESTTLDASYSPVEGLVVSEEAWAKELSFGPLTLTDVPAFAATSAEVAALGSSQYESRFGLAALKRMDFIVDGRKGIAYVRPKKTPPPPCEHNRLGAVFVPRDDQNDDLIAHVVAGSPAHEAGIRNGDVLLKIADLDVTRWRADPAVLPLSRFWQEPAGTKLRLTLRRGNETPEISVLLRDILPSLAD